MNIWVNSILDDVTSIISDGVGTDGITFRDSSGAENFQISTNGTFRYNKTENSIVISQEGSNASAKFDHAFLPKAAAYRVNYNSCFNTFEYNTPTGLLKTGLNSGKVMDMLRTCPRDSKVFTSGRGVKIGLTKASPCAELEGFEHATLNNSVLEVLHHPGRCGLYKYAGTPYLNHISIIFKDDQHMANGDQSLIESGAQLYVEFGKLVYGFWVRQLLILVPSYRGLGEGLIIKPWEKASFHPYLSADVVDSMEYKNSLLSIYSKGSIWAFVNMTHLIINRTKANPDSFIVGNYTTNPALISVSQKQNNSRQLFFENGNLFTNLKNFTTTDEIICKSHYEQVNQVAIIRRGWIQLGLLSVHSNFILTRSVDEQTILVTMSDNIPGYNMVLHLSVEECVFVVKDGNLLIMGKLFITQQATKKYCSVFISKLIIVSYFANCYIFRSYDVIIIILVML